MKDYISIPRSEISYEDLLLTKLEVRLKKDKSTQTSILIQFAQGEKMRMKIIDKFEWACLMEIVNSLYSCLKE